MRAYCSRVSARIRPSVACRKNGSHCRRIRSALSICPPSGHCPAVTSLMNACRCTFGESRGLGYAAPHCDHILDRQVAPGAVERHADLRRASAGRVEPRSSATRHKRNRVPATGREPHRVLIQRAVTWTDAVVRNEPPPRSSISLPSITDASESKKKLQCAISRPSKRM